MSIGGEGVIDLRDVMEGEYVGCDEFERERYIGIVEYF